MYLSKNPFVYANNRTFLGELNDYYSKLSNEMLANYLCIYYINSQINYLDFEAEKYVDKNSIEEVNNLKTTDSNDMDKIKLIDTYFSLISDHLFVNRCVDKKAIEIVQKMVDQVKVSLIKISLKWVKFQWGAEQILIQTEWFDEESRSKALLKLKLMKSYVGTFNSSMSVQKLDEYYELLKFSPNDTLRELNAKYSLFAYQKICLSVLNPQIQIETEIVRASESNAFYVPNHNAIGKFFIFLFLNLK